jgi:hypothetical protein
MLFFKTALPRLLSNYRVSDPFLPFRQGWGIASAPCDKSPNINNLIEYLGIRRYLWPVDNSWETTQVSWVPEMHDFNQISRYINVLAFF